MKVLSLRAIFACLILLLASSCSYKHKKFENPITKDTEQPDKQIFDKAIKDIEKSRYEIARLQLQVLLSTYESSEYTAKAKLAVADSWRLEGGARGYAQAEAEYKDFILFYPQMEEAAESQMRLCEIHYKQMDKDDRDPKQALLAEQECRQLLVQFPNSKFAAKVEQYLRDTQEVIAMGEQKTADFYRSRGNYNAAANRYGGVADQYPLYSKADESLWYEADAYKHLGQGWRGREGEALAKIVQEYPLSEWAGPAKKRLTELEVKIPDADPVAAARMQYNMDNRERPGMMGRAFSFMGRAPDTWTAAKNGAPQMEKAKQNVPPLVPAPGGTAPAGLQGDVTVGTADGKTGPSTGPGAAPGTGPQAPAQK